MKIVVFWALCGLAAIGISLWDTYRYPVCPLCHNNTCTRRPRIFGLPVCRVHGTLHAQTGSS